MRDNQRIDCRKCRYYFVTWEPAQPHGCRAMGFKSLHLPSTVVQHHSRSKCRAFAPIPRKPPPQAHLKKGP